MDFGVDLLVNKKRSSLKYGRQRRAECSQHMQSKRNMVEMVESVEMVKIAKKKFMSKKRGRR